MIQYRALKDKFICNKNHHGTICVINGGVVYLFFGYEKQIGHEKHLQMHDGRRILSDL